MRKPIFSFGMFVPVVLIATTRHIYESDGAQGIQNAINASAAYDTVFVHTGTYYVRDVDSIGITMKDSVILVSPYPDSVTLSGLNSSSTDTAYHVIYCYLLSRLAVIQGFTITQGQAKGGSPHNRGGGIYCYQSSPTIQNNMIVGNSAILGGGIYYSNSSPVLQNNVIQNNSASSGGGIYWYGQQSFPLTHNNIIKENIAENGGGVCFYKSSPVLQDNTIQNNLAYAEGGGLYSSQCWPNIQYSIIAGNLAESGGGFFCTNKSGAKFLYSVLANNIAGKEGGAIYSRGGSKLHIDSCFIVDNGSIDSTKSGLLYLPGEGYLYSDTVRISCSHLYYNTFQSDIEIDNNTGSNPDPRIVVPTTALLLQNNFWWDTTDVGISALIEGPNDHTPWEYDFIPGVPGEPISIDSIRNYDSSYYFIIDSLENDPDTLYIRIYGQDRNTNFREAGVAVIKSTIYPTGIAVALVETDTNSGIYQGKATIKVTTGNDTIRLDDIYNLVKADTACNPITITANMDTAQKFVVYYKCGVGVEEDSKLQIADYRLEVYPNPFSQKTTIVYKLIRGQVDKGKPVEEDSMNLSTYQPINLSIYDLCGRLVKSWKLEIGNWKFHEVVWDGRGDFGKKAPSGVYFCKLEVEAGLINQAPTSYKQMKKIVLIR